ncbi:hypothetical protein HYX00_02085, partial [Candidatus Woesearchaeota archaeon]|nr:hypothetical protein [Candidatus Woesearchaeota archaeon]
MTPVSLKTIHEDLRSLQKDVEFIKHAIAEDFELSNEAKKQLEEARKTPRADYISQKNIEKE